MSTTEPRVTRTQADRYDVRSGKAGEWATLIVCTDGQLLVQSDYGNWAHFWSCHGCRSFKHFLVEIDTAYLINKFGGTRAEFDGEKTLVAMQTEISRQHADGTLEHIAQQNKGDFADGEALALAALKELSDASFSEAEDVYSLVCNDAVALALIFPDAVDLPLVYADDPALVNFTQRLWPLFVAELKKELQREDPKNPGDALVH